MWREKKRPTGKAIFCESVNIGCVDHNRKQACEDGKKVRWCIVVAFPSRDLLSEMLCGYLRKVARSVWSHQGVCRS